MEKYILIPGFDNYAVSSKGNLKNVKNGKVLKLHTNKSGYNTYVLSQDSIKKCFKIHRLVGILFIPNPTNKPYINHIDGNKSNNHVSNLEWSTAKENDTHARANGLKKNNKPVKSIWIENGTQTVFYSTGEASAVLGINKGTIHKVLSGKYKQTHGYMFEYLENEKEYNVEYKNYSSF